MTTNAASLHLSANQFAHARDIIAEVKRRGQPKRVAVIAIEAALAESGLQMYANGNNPASLALPHDAVGWDHGSVGLFQQQVGGAAGSTANWGTTKELMNVRVSCGKFLDALHAVNWHISSNWEACQDVQHSAYDGHPRPANNNSSVYGGNYQAQDNRAAGIVNAFWTGPVGKAVELPSGAKYWVDIFERAPVLPEPGGTAPTGALYPGRNYVFGKRWGKKVETADGFNHWWLRTDPDEGSGRWVSAYYLTHWGNDQAKDNNGHDIPNC
jgi:hypothetical protein